MRPREAYEICKREEEKIQRYEKEIAECYFNITDEKYLLRYVRACQNFYRYVKENLGSMPFIAQVLNIVRENIDDADSSNANVLWNSINEVCRRIRCIISMYDTSHNLNEKYIGLDIKIPKIDNITELKRFIDDLEFVFTKCPFLQDDEESLKLQSVDNGSIWLIFVVVGASVAVGSVLLNNFAAFVDKCFVIKSHKNTCDMQKLQIKNEEMEQKEKEVLLESINKVYKISVNKAIKELQVSTGHQIQDGDEMGRAEQSFDKMIKMLDQGLQIYSAINSPEEVKALFKPLEMHYLSIEKGLERIEDKENTDSE